MKILFTADIHIKLGQKNVPVPWARNRFELFVKQLAEMQKSADLVILGGDIYDRIPTMDEVELYFDLVASMTKRTLIYPGNHEMLKKDTTFLSFLKNSTKRLNPLVEIIDDYYSDEYIDIIPYNRLKHWVDNYGELDFSNKILCSHFRAEIPPHVKAEIPLHLLDKWDVVLAGDLHSYENSQRNILYPGSPYTTSFHRTKVDTGAILLDTDTLEHKWLKFGLPQLIRKTIEAGGAMVATTFDHTIYEVTGSISELSAVENTGLIDKKISSRESDVALILDPKMSMSEELREYLEYILCLSEKEINEVMSLFMALEAKING